MNPQLEELALLEPDWDSYGSPPPTFQSLETADLLLNRYGNGQQPTIAPTQTGGICMEWLTPRTDIIINVGAMGGISVYVRIGRKDREGPLQRHANMVQEALTIINGPPAPPTRLGPPTKKWRHPPDR